MVSMLNKKNVENNTIDWHPEEMLDQTNTAVRCRNPLMPEHTDSSHEQNVM